MELATRCMGGLLTKQTESVSQVRTSSWLDRFAYLTGVGILQRLTWEAGLRRILRFSGGRKIEHGTSTVEWP